MFKLRYLPAAIVPALLMVACSQRADKPAVDKKQQSETLIQEHFRYLNDHDLKAIVAQYSPKAAISAADHQGTAMGTTGADAVYHLEFYESPDAKYLVDKIVNADSTVIVEYDVVGLRDKAHGNIRYDVRKCSVFRIDSLNKISSENTYVNRAAYNAAQR